MTLTKEHLTNTFDEAREGNASFVFIAISAEGTEEVIVVPKKSFDKKEEFYNKAYNDELVHCMNSQVHIRGLSYGESEELHNII